jgi:hypothetical protein
VETQVRRERQDRSDRHDKDSGSNAGSNGAPAPSGQSAAARDLQRRLERGLGTRVKLVEADPTRGHIEIHYHSLDELDTLLAKLLPE